MGVARVLKQLWKTQRKKHTVLNAIVGDIIIVHHKGELGFK